jgi:hypothetical protein
MLNAIYDSKYNGINIRYIIEVTDKNMDYCKELMEIVDLRHLNKLDGNFILNEKEYVSISHSNNNSYLNKGEKWSTSHSY